MKPNLPAWTLPAWPKRKTWPWVVQWSCAICLFAHNILMQSNKHLPNKNAPNPPPSCRSGSSVWPQRMSQFFNTPISRGLQQTNTGSITKQEDPPGCTKVSMICSDISQKMKLLTSFQGINQMNSPRKPASSRPRVSPLSSACARSCTLGFRIWPPPKLHDCGEWRSWDSRDRGIFSED